MQHRPTFYGQFLYVSLMLLTTFITELSLLETFCRAGRIVAIHTGRPFFRTDNAERWVGGLTGSRPHLAGMLESVHTNE